MVFAANGATGRRRARLGARFAYAERAAEGPAYLRWFAANGFPVKEPVHVNEGEGDFLTSTT